MNWKTEQDPRDKDNQEALLGTGKPPVHLAIIMDGNGRWAVDRSYPRVEGHRQGIESVRDIVKASSQIGIKYLTLYAFSIENWKRPAAEVTGLMKLLEYYLKKELDELHENGVAVRTIGKLNALPRNIQKLLAAAYERTKDNEGLVLNLALSYSGRWDIMRAVQMVSLDIRRGKLSPEDINEELFASYLQTSGLPDPDLLIRTSGEMRLSNFLLWEMAYGEIFVTDKLWPEFRRGDLYSALENYMKRERRYGMTTGQIKEDNDHASYIQRVVNAFKKN